MDLPSKAFLAIILALGLNRRVKQRCWMKGCLKEREKYSHVVLLKEISAREAVYYENYFGMNEETFNKLMEKTKPLLSRFDFQIYQATAKFSDMKTILEKEKVIENEKYVQDTLTMDIIVIELKSIVKIDELPAFERYGVHLPHNKDVETYGYGGMFSLITPESKMQKSKSKTYKRKSAKKRYPNKVHEEYTIALKLTKIAASSMDIGSLIVVYKSNIIVGLTLYPKLDKWDEREKKTVVLAIEACREEVAKFIKNATSNAFKCDGQE